MYINSQGQISAEFVMVAGFMLVIACSMALFIGQEIELTQAMAAARSGAGEGAMVNSFAIYPDETFSEYMKDQPRLLSPSGVKIVRIDYKDQGFNSLYNRTKIQLKIYAVAPSINSPKDKNCAGDRINFYARKSISTTFNTEYLTNSFYNPAFSDRYVFTTADIQWI